jgi:murein DD-endopeptidase MepM/ murein hydrolase activator NlpD
MKPALFPLGLVAIMASACAVSAEAPQDEIAAAATESASPTPPAPAAETAPDPAKEQAFEAEVANVEASQRIFAAASGSVVIEGPLVQGGLVYGTTLPGATVSLDGEPVMVSEAGRFLLGFGRDHGASALLVVTLPGGEVVRRTLDIADREFKIERIDGLDQSKVSGFTPEQLAKIAADREKKNAARAVRAKETFWASGFIWPVTGRISGVFGSQRILNGEPQNMHSGVDVAAPAGTPVKAPAPGIVRLAETGMYFEGGLIFIDHGQKLESAFLHLSRVDVKPGDAVAQGDVIGAVGATGRATGPHMHWSLRWTDRLVDPQLTVGEMPQPAKPESAGD